jgi:hypothetical protein
MPIALKVFLTIFYFGILGRAGSSSACAQAKQIDIALKSGETVQLGSVYWNSNCRSLLTATPVAEVMEGPEELTVSVKAAMVTPRTQQCAKEQKGGLLSVTAKEVKEKKEVKLIIRMKYATKDGERQGTRFYNVALFP